MDDIEIPIFLYLTRGEVKALTMIVKAQQEDPPTDMRDDIITAESKLLIALNASLNIK